MWCEWHMTHYFVFPYIHSKIKAWATSIFIPFVSIYAIYFTQLGHLVSHFTFPFHMNWNAVCVLKLVLIVDLGVAYDMAQPACSFLFLYPAFLVCKIQSKDKTGWLHSFRCLLFHMLKSFTCYMTKKSTCENATNKTAILNIMYYMYSVLT